MKGDKFMLEMLKNKWMILFIIICLTMTYINGCCIQKNASAVNTDIMQLNK